MILFTIIGAMIGAGFASGQEIYVFFYRFGFFGILGIITCNILMSYIIYKTLNLMLKYKFKNYKEFVNKIFESSYFKFNKIINIIVNVFLCITFFIMISAFGQYFNQQFRNQ